MTPQGRSSPPAPARPPALVTPQALAEVCAEVQAVLGGRPVQKIVQPEPTTVLLGFHGGWLLLSADARLGRLHLVSGKPPGTGEAAPAFCMLLRKELTGTRLVSCTAVPGERACELVFGRLPGAVAERRLRLFLFGRSAQLQLVGEEGRVLGHIGPARRLHEGLPAAREPSETRSREQATGDRRQATGDGRRLGPSAELEARSAQVAIEEARARALKAAGERLRAALDKQRRKTEALRADRDRALAAGDKRKLGDLLLAHLAEVPRGAAEVTLPDDFADGAPLTIALDPARGPRENAERFYKAHKRLTRALGSIEARLGEHERALAKLEAELARVEAGDLPPATVGEPVPERPGRAREPKAGPRPPYKRFRSSTGAEILVGRGADKNDQLTFKVARGNDLWMHTRDVPGAHVVVPLSPGVPVDEQTLLDAATLAAHHSNARGEAQVDVGYTLRKHVRKPPRSKPGSVTTSGMKTIRVRLEPERLARLLASADDA